MVGKRSIVDFTIEMDNPQARPYDVIWTLDLGTVPGTDELVRSIAFEESGLHYVTVILISPEVTCSISWNVTVTNEAPFIETWSPENLTLIILEEGVVRFDVEASDPDGDTLSYEWLLGGEAVRFQHNSSLSVLLPFNNNTHYTLHVVVGDGEEATSLEWDITPLPQNGPPTVPDDGTNWVPMGASILTILVALGAITLAYLYIRGRSYKGPG